MQILALDLSKARTGWAIWHSGWDMPRYGSVELGSAYTSPGRVYAKLHEELAGLFTAAGFEAIYYEAAILPQNLSGNTNLQALQLAAGLAAHVQSFAYVASCRTTEVNISTWRKDFLSSDTVSSVRAEIRARKAAGGKGSARDKLKKLTVDRCRQLGFSPRYDDEADALGILDFALDFHEHVRPPWRANEVLRAPLGAA